MSVEDALLRLLRKLAERQRWTLSEVPSEVTDDDLRCLDDRGWIELLTYGPYVGSRDSYAWFSPSRSPRRAGDWDSVVQTYRLGIGPPDDVHCDLRVSAKGKAKLAEAKKAPGGVRRIASWVV